MTFAIGTLRRAAVRPAPAVRPLNALGACVVVTLNQVVASEHLKVRMISLRA